MAALIGRVRKERFDAIVDFHGGPRAFLITLFSGARRKIGYAVKYKSFIYDVKIPRAKPDGPIHSVENHLNLVKALGVKAGDAPPLKLAGATAEEILRINRVWEENRFAGSKVIAVHVGAGNEFRDWGGENWAALADHLGRMSGVRVVLVGGGADREREKEILTRIEGRAASLVGRLNLAELGEVLGRACLFIGPDSGPMHIAAASGVPIVALFGPTLPAHFAPWRSRAAILEKRLDCRPCRQRECVERDFRCLRGISVDEVLAAAQRLLRD